MQQKKLELSGLNYINDQHYYYYFVNQLTISCAFCSTMDDFDFFLQLQDHNKKECPTGELKCPFNVVGCPFEVQKVAFFSLQNIEKAASL